jgi:hypothetical protein
MIQSALDLEILSVLTELKDGHEHTVLCLVDSQDILHYEILNVATARQHGAPTRPVP